MKLIKMMKKKILLFILSLTVFTINAQKVKRDKEKIKALKIAFLTQELDLNATVAQKFWPIYNEHENNLDAIRRTGMSQFREKINNLGGLEALSEKDSKSFVNAKLELDKKTLQEKEQFLAKITKILPYKKILKLQLSEREFARKLMRKYRKRP